MLEGFIGDKLSQSFKDIENPKTQFNAMMFMLTEFFSILTKGAEDLQFMLIVALKERSCVLSSDNTEFTNEQLGAFTEHFKTFLTAVADQREGGSSE